MPRKAFEEPSRTRLVESEVAVIGPGNVGLSMTPEAAEETGKRLIETASRAREAGLDVDKAMVDDIIRTVAAAARLEVAADALAMIAALEITDPALMDNLSAAVLRAGDSRDTVSALCVAAVLQAEAARLRGD
jgi:glutamate dehydrogenase/leucine dehydrogenase